MLDGESIGKIRQPKNDFEANAALIL